MLIVSFFKDGSQARRIAEKARKGFWFKVAYSSANCGFFPSKHRTGQPAKADAALNAVGKLTFVDCYRFSGDARPARRLEDDLPAGYYAEDWEACETEHTAR